MGKSCTYNDKTYSDGSVVCQSGYEYRCNDGTWDALNTKCEDDDGKHLRGEQPKLRSDSDRAARQKLGRGVMRRQESTTFTALKAGVPLVPPTDTWHIVEELYFEGAHWESGSWHSQTWVYENQNPGGKVEFTQQELKKDDDAKWEVFQPSPNRVEYRLSASSCIFSCDEVRIRVYIRWVNP